MKMDKIAASKNDEFYTPEYAIKPLLKYLKPKSNIWCPFDTGDSNFCKTFTYEKHSVFYTHIQQGEDFFDKEVQNLSFPKHCDYIISNPPYSLKTEVLQELFKIGKPFAMLVGVAGLFESQRRFEMFRDNDFEIMYLNRRVSYFKSYKDEKPSLNPPFSSVYICHKILPEKIVFEEIVKK